MFLGIHNSLLNTHIPGGGVLGLRTYVDVPLENLKSYAIPEPGGYSHCGLIGGPVRAKEGQSKNFEKYPQMAVCFCKNPQMVVHELENWIIW